MDNDHLRFILMHVSPHIAQMRSGEVTDCKGMFDPELWHAAPSDEHRHVFGRPIAMLVAQGKIPLRFIGFDRSRHNLYEKI